MQFPQPNLAHRLRERTILKKIRSQYWLDKIIRELEEYSDKGLYECVLWVPFKHSEEIIGWLAAECLSVSSERRGIDVKINVSWEEK